MIRRIEAVLTAPQREPYHQLIGAPFDMTLLAWRPQDNRQVDVMMVSRALGGGGGGGGGGQQADPDFNTKVARPAYATSDRHPRVLFDEAHHNFHTASGRYKPFADLITSDGYQVIPNTAKFSRESLRRGDILIIANALGAEGMGQPGAADPAFTDAECDAVRDWIKEGGTLLFITDHAPMGSAAECLAKRFNVSMSKGATSDPQNSEGGDPGSSSPRRTTSWATTRSSGAGMIPSGSTASRPSPARRSRAPRGASPFLKLAETAVDNSFDDEKPTSAAGRAQGLALGFGKGRIVVLGEAAELSAQVRRARRFGMNVAGHR